MRHCHCIVEETLLIYFLNAAKMMSRRDAMYNTCQWPKARC